MAASMPALAILKIGLSIASARASIPIALMTLMGFCQREGLLVISVIVRSAIAPFWAKVSEGLSFSSWAKSC